jgi:hypothetical protein
LALTDWGRTKNQMGDVISFRIRNIGRGTAIYGLVNHRDLARNVSYVSNQLSIIAPKEQSAFTGSIHVLWKDVPAYEKTGVQRVQFGIYVFSWDAAGMRHDTEYTVSVYSPAENVQGNGQLAPGLFWESRKTTTRPPWLLRVRSSRVFGRVRAFGCLIGIMKPIRDASIVGAFLCSGVTIRSDHPEPPQTKGG